MTKNQSTSDNAYVLKVDIHVTDGKTNAIITVHSKVPPIPTVEDLAMVLHQALDYAKSLGWRIINRSEHEAFLAGVGVEPTTSRTKKVTRPKFLN